MTGSSPSTASLTPGWQGRVEAAEAKRTLDQRLAQGRLPLAEAMRLAASLAEALRGIHDEGRVHGGLTASRVEVTAAGVTLVPPRTTAGPVTPYTAPEVVRGQPADIRSDIFSFGAIVYEMATGRRPFEGDTPEALSAALLNAPVPSAGNPALDGLLANCLAKDPTARWQRIQKAQMELRLLTVSARRTESGPARRQNVEALIRAEVQRAVESTLGARLEAQERAVTDLQQAVTASLQAMQAHLCTVDAKLAAALERAVRSEEATAEVQARLSDAEQRAEAPHDRIAQASLLLQSATERIARAEQATESVRRHAAEFAEGASVRLHSLEQAAASQAEALEATRKAVAQTDDLVERVVEALDSLQSIVLERADERSSVN